ncbi:hypothetical protein BI308_11060 [Roseofilum reptotaenium AO1-A]|uniref:Methyltransferase type 11 n=2 Tax=Roseofilum TaxID=1233426 RepID=A0A1L9QS83_9CYAN|nr:hypothetical protein BI308_11060 [Roseofilum reptotaenium AO1-A]
MNLNKNQSQEGICLHIGCGIKVVERWKNIDSSPSLRLSKFPFVGSSICRLIGAPNWPEIAQCGDVLKGINIPNSSCDLIYAAHVFEHLSYIDFSQALDNVYNYLKPGGIVRIIVPDLEKYIQTYIKNRSDNQREHQAAFEFMYHSFIGHQGSRSHIYQRIKEIFSNYRHQWMWDIPSLKTAFANQGFTQIRQCQYGDWLDSRFALVEVEEVHVGSICIEAIKPTGTIKNDSCATLK